MKMNDFVASCLGMDGSVFDDYCDAFGVEITDDDVESALSEVCGHWTDFGMVILRVMWDKVIDEFSHILDPNEFDCDFSSPSYPDFLYGGENVYGREDLEKIAERQYEDDEKG